MKKAQVWTVDFILGLMLFLVVLVASVKLATSLNPSSNFNQLYADNVHLSDLLLESGYPTDWNDSNVIIPGLANSNRINLTKLDFYANISYNNTKTLFHLTNEYIFFFRNKTSVINTSKSCIRGFNIEYDNNCEPNIDSINYSNLAIIDRIVILNSTLVTMTVYMWN